VNASEGPSALQEKRGSRLRSSSTESKLMSGLSVFARANSGVALTGWALNAPVITFRRAGHRLPILRPILPALEELQE
jgi:hypothetical protein